MRVHLQHRCALAAFAGLAVACGRSSIFSDVGTVSAGTSGSGSSAAVGPAAGSAASAGSTTRGGTAARTSSSDTGGQASSGASAIGGASGDSSTGTSSAGTSGGGTETAASGGSTGEGRTTGDTSGGTSSAATSTGSSGSGSCNPSLALDELASCAGPTGCACPLTCVQDAALNAFLCEYPCQSLDDCPNLSTTCVGGSCQPTPCGPDTLNGSADGVCTAVGGADGSCLPGAASGVSSAWLCAQGGAARSACDPAADRSQIAQACGAGDDCTAFDGGLCLPLCDPFAAAPCGPSASCVRPPGADPRVGVCQPLPASSTTSGGGTSGSAGSSTGSSNGGSTGGSTGGCNPVQNPFATCQNSQSCGCGLTCADDPAAGGKVCEFSCSSTAECPSLFTTCQAGACSVFTCDGETGNGSFNATCTLPGNLPGSCVPYTLDAGLSSVGYCYQAGDAVGTCDPSPNRQTPPGQICPPAAICLGGVGSFGGTCNALCDPTDGFCAGDQICSGIVNEPDLGICTTF